MSHLSISNSVEGLAHNRGETDLVCAFMLLTSQWGLGAASIPGQTDLKDKESVGLMLGNLGQEAGLQGVPAVRLVVRWPPGTVPGLP